MKKESIFKTIAVVIGYFVLFTAVQLATIFVAQLFEEDATQADGLLILLISLVLFFAVMLVIYRIRRESFLARIKWNPVLKPTYVLVAMFAVFNILAINFLMSFLMPQNWVEGAVEYSAFHTGGDFMLAFMLTVLAAPFVEELLFRGLMTTRMLGRLPTWLVVVAPTLLFGIGHASGGMGQVVGTIMISFVFTFTFIWTKSLRAAFLAHALNNLFVFVAGSFSPLSVLFDNINAPIQLILGIICVVLTVLSGYLIYKRWDKKFPVWSDCEA